MRNVILCTFGMCMNICCSLIKKSLCWEKCFVYFCISRVLAVLNIVYWDLAASHSPLQNKTLCFPQILKLVLLSHSDLSHFLCYIY